MNILQRKQDLLRRRAELLASKQAREEALGFTGANRRNLGLDRVEAALNQLDNLLNKLEIEAKENARGK